MAVREVAAYSLFIQGVLMFLFTALALFACAGSSEGSTAPWADQVCEVDYAESVVFDAVEVRTVEPPILTGEPLGWSDWLPVEPSAVDTLPPMVGVCDGPDVDDGCVGA